MRAETLRYAYLLLGLTLVRTAGAQPGVFDPSFGTGGIATGDSLAAGWDLAIDRHERVVFVGVHARPDEPPAAIIGRLSPDGALDPSWAGTGVRSLAGVDACEPPARASGETAAPHPHGPVEGGGAETFFSAVALWGGGAAVAAGGIDDCGFIARFRDDGALDPDFASGGLFRFRSDTASWAFHFEDVGVAADGSVTAVGSEIRYVGGGPRYYVLVVRLTPQGTLDPTFGTGGLVLLFGGSADQSVAVSDLALYPDGRVVLAGAASGSSSYDTFVARLRSDGALDPTFGSGGWAAYDILAGFDDEVISVLHGPVDALYLAGRVSGHDDQMMFGARLRSDGTLDPTWGGGGRTLIPSLSAAGCLTSDAVLDPEGRLVLAGDCYWPAGTTTLQTWALARLVPAGRVDSTFGTNGVVYPDLPGDRAQLSAIARQSDGRLVAVGSLSRDPATQSSEWTVARFLNGATTATGGGPAGEGLSLTVAPNPASQSAEVLLYLDVTSDVRVVVYDLLGRMALLVHDGPLGAGAHRLPLDLGGLARGTYVVRVEAGGTSASRRVAVR